MAERTPLSSPQILTLKKWINFLIVVVSVWIGFSNSSKLLIAQGVLLLPLVVANLIGKSRFFSVRKQLDFVWSILASLLLGTFLTLQFVNLSGPNQDPNSGAMMVVSILAILTQLGILMGLEKKQLKMQFFRDNSGWIIVLATSITLFFSKYTLLDITIASGFLIYLIVRQFLSISTVEKETTDETANSENITVIELPKSVISQLLEIKFVEKLYDFKVIDLGEEEMVFGSLILGNKTTQEEIYQAKTEAKKIISNAGYEDSTIEVKYLIEFEQEQKNIEEDAGSDS